MIAQTVMEGDYALAPLDGATPEAERVLAFGGLLSLCPAVEPHGECPFPRLLRISVHPSAVARVHSIGPAASGWVEDPACVGLESLSTLHRGFG